MKNIFITLIVSLCAVQSIVAQDVLITTDGEVMSVYIDDIGSSTIYYKSASSDNTQQLQRIDKSKVYMIKKADGTKIDLSGASTPIQQATTPAAQPMNTELSEEAKQRNKELIADINSKIPQLNDYAKLGKKANMLYYCFGIQDSCIIANDDIEVQITDNSGPSDLFARDRGIVFTIKNNTQKTVYGRF